MKTVTTEQMRELDRRTIRNFVPGELLMERAGAGVARSVSRIAAGPSVEADHIVLVAGKGNNGGDAFVAARHLAQEGFSVVVLLTVAPGELSGDARLHFDAMSETPSVTWRHVQEAEWGEEITRLSVLRCLVVDGVLGTGVRGPARDAAAAAIGFINALGASHPVVAIDVPSGMDADTGIAAGPVVTADTTVTMAFPKRGLLLPAAVDCVGNIDVVEIGIPSSLSDGLTSDIEMIASSDLHFLARRRVRSSHKGTYGHVLLVGGSPGYSGAVVMAARAALRSGVGLVSILTPASVADVVAGQVPEAMVHAGKQTATGGLAGDSVELWMRDKAPFDSILAGPGMRADRDTQGLTERLLAGSRVPLVMDADALNACAHRTFLVKRASCPVILTPHPGEMARLLAISIQDVQGDRLGVARTAAEATRAVVVLKGAGTIVARHGSPLHVNATGNAGMATGGMGDVLAGLIVGLTAQGIDSFDAARAAVYLHGRAGDIAAMRSTPVGLGVSDLLQSFPDALCELFREP